jgi:3'-5' exoribonuclease
MLIKELDGIIEQVADHHYHQLLTAIFSDGILRRQFTFAPAAKLWHHSYIGGLAHHTLNVTKLALKACEVYDGLDRDLLVSGALLHDLGKAETYSLENYFDYTDDGRLLGHIVIADRIITSKINRLPDFPAEKKKLIRHLVLSHQGTYEQASPVLPQTLEANILYVLDLLDSRVGGILKVINKSRQPGQRWSGYVKLLERYLYFGDNMKGE